MQRERERGRKRENPPRANLPEPNMGGLTKELNVKEGWAHETQNCKWTRLEAKNEISVASQNRLKKRKAETSRTKQVKDLVTNGASKLPDEGNLDCFGRKFERNSQGRKAHTIIWRQTSTRM